MARRVRHPAPLFGIISPAFCGKTVLLPCDDPEWSNFTKFFAQNFERFGLKRLISTSYATESKNIKQVYQPTLFESAAPQFDRKKTRVRGKIFVLDHDTNKNGRIDIEDLEWDYLKGDGDFRSDEVKKLRDEADIIVTNPPFSLFREFLAWTVGDGKVYSCQGCSVVHEHRAWAAAPAASADEREGQHQVFEAQGGP